MGRPARHRQEIENVREDILHAAGRAFARQGFDRTTIHDIAKEAGYTAPSLYTYFKGKQEIVGALVAAIRRQFEAAFDAEIPDHLRFGERLALLFERLADVAERWPEARLLLLEFKRPGSASLRASHKRVAKHGMDARLIEWLKANASSPKDFGGRKPEEIAFVLHSLIIGSVLHARRKDAPARDRFSLALQVCLHGLGGG